MDTVSSADARFTNPDFITEFIELYRLNTCLWHVKSIDYSNRNQRDSAYESLVDLCKKINPECDIKFVKKKIANLRTAFRKEYAKVKFSYKSGAGARDIYVPKLWYYKLLEFTADHEEPLESFCGIGAAQDTQHGEDDVPTNESDVEEKNEQDEKTYGNSLSSTPVSKKAKLNIVSLFDARLTHPEFLTEFIELYRVNTCLWNVKTTGYSNREKRFLAYKSLVDLCKKFHPKCDIKFVKNKIANLRTTFRKELNKVRSSYKSAASERDQYVPKLWYYKLLEFTADHEEPLESFYGIFEAQDTQPADDDIQINEPDAEDKDNEAEKQSSSRLSSTSCTSIGRELEHSASACQVYNLVEQAMSIINKSEDECDIFARHVSTELRAMGDVQRAIAKQQMSNIIFQGRMNHLSQSGSTNFDLSNWLVKEEF